MRQGRGSRTYFHIFLACVHFGILTNMWIWFSNHDMNSNNYQFSWTSLTPTAEDLGVKYAKSHYITEHIIIRMWVYLSIYSYLNQSIIHLPSINHLYKKQSKYMTQNSKFIYSYPHSISSHIPGIRKSVCILCFMVSYPAFPHCLFP